MTSVAIAVEDSSTVGQARRAAVQIADSCGLGESGGGRVALIATEAATNMIRHAGGGELIVSKVTRQGRTGVQMLAVDRGPGMDVPRCLRDGYSTAGSSGTGLGAIERLSSETDFYSVPGKGTVVLARVWAGITPGCGTVEWSTLVVPLAGETACGDACALRERPELSVLLADGLGHGPGAAEASAAAVAVFEQRPFDNHVDLMQRMHEALRPTRGAAVALARFSPTENSVAFTSVGNVVGAVLGNGTARQMIAYPGTVGMEVRKLAQLGYPWPAGALVVLHTDGIVTHWSLEPYPALAGHDPAIIAAVVYRDFSRRRDDASVVVVRRRAP